MEGSHKTNTHFHLSLCNFSFPNTQLQVSLLWYKLNKFFLAITISMLLLLIYMQPLDSLCEFCCLVLKSKPRLLSKATKTCSFFLTELLSCHFCQLNWQAKGEGRTSTRTLQLRSTSTTDEASLLRMYQEKKIL